MNHKALMIVTLLSSTIALQGSDIFPPLLYPEAMRQLIEIIIMQAVEDDCLDEIPDALFSCHEDLMHEVEPCREDLITIAPILFKWLWHESIKKNLDSLSTVSAMRSNQEDEEVHESDEPEQYEFSQDDTREKIDLILNAVTQEYAYESADQKGEYLFSRNTVLQRVNDLIDVIAETRDIFEKDLEDKIQQVSAGLVRSQKNIQRSIDALSDGMSHVEKSMVTYVTDLKHEMQRVDVELHQVLSLLKNLVEEIVTKRTSVPEEMRPLAQE